MLALELMLGLNLVQHASGTRTAHVLAWGCTVCGTWKDGKADDGQAQAISVAGLDGARTGIDADLTPAMQVPEDHEPAVGMPATINVPSAAAEVLIAPTTPDRIASGGRASAAHLLHDMPNLPVMSMLLTRPTASQKVRLAPTKS